MGFRASFATCVPKLRAQSGFAVGRLVRPRCAQNSPIVLALGDFGSDGELPRTSALRERAFVALPITSREARLLQKRSGLVSWFWSEEGGLVRFHSLGSLRALGSLVWLLLLALCVLPCQAAPITIAGTQRLTEVCDTFPANVGSCTPDDRLVKFSFTYDPDTLVLDVSRPDEPTLRTAGPLSYEISLPALDDPWGGVITREAHASVEFGGDPTGTRRQWGLHILDSDLQDGCSLDGICDRGWLTVFEFVKFGPGLPVDVPRAEDFEQMFHTSGGPGSSFVFMTVAWYTPIGGTERIYLPESRLYFSDVPEPAIAILTPLGVTAFALRRRARRT